MTIAYVMAEDGTNPLLSNVAERLLALGVRVAGTVQINSPRLPTQTDTHKCDMDVTVLPDGPVIRISQNLGSGSSGCRLDSDALEQAVGRTLSKLDQADVLIVNKFGKSEASGRGFREVIAQAVMADIPVLLSVNALNLDAFMRFCGGDATQLPPNQTELVLWARDAIPRI